MNAENKCVIALDVGIVKKVKRDLCYVEIAKSDKCNGCKACAFGRKQKITLKAIKNVECSVGDKVAVSVYRAQNATVAYLSMFCLPLIFMLIFAFIARICIGGDLFVAIGVAVGLTVGLFCSFIINLLVERKAKRQGNYPTVIKRI